MLQVQSVVFANTGTLLLCLVDLTGQLAAMRQKIRDALPGIGLPHTSINYSLHDPVSGTVDVI